MRHPRFLREHLHPVSETFMPHPPLVGYCDRKMAQNFPGVGGSKFSWRVAHFFLDIRTNTLILAYVGGATPLLLLLMAQGGGTAWNKIFNLDLVATEFVRGLTGSIGLVLSIPVTAIIAGFLMGNSDHHRYGVARKRNRGNYLSRPGNNDPDT